VRRRVLIAVGASAGGVEALSLFVAALPADFQAAVLVVLHLPEHARSALPQILDDAGPLPARHADDGEKIEHGRIYVGPPGVHLVVRDGQVELSRGPKENRHRPSVDGLFRSVALSYGPRGVGIVLSGSLDDGVAGLLAIKRHGGIAMVQDPEKATFPGMPQSALDNVQIDHCGRVVDLAARVIIMAQASSAASGRRTAKARRGSRRGPRNEEADRDDGHPLGSPSLYTCPECHGTLWEVDEGGLPHFRCRVGHAYGARTLFEEHVRSAAERAELLRRVLKGGAKGDVA
jgi:two-component system chemotaxis response regulator CheB